MNNLIISSLVTLLFTLFSASAFSQTDMSFTWKGTVPPMKAKIEQPITIENTDLSKQLYNKTWIIEDLSQSGVHDNKYGIVKILTTNI